MVAKTERPEPYLSIHIIPTECLVRRSAGGSAPTSGRRAIGCERPPLAGLPPNRRVPTRMPLLSRTPRRGTGPPAIASSSCGEALLILGRVRRRYRAVRGGPEEVTKRRAPAPKNQGVSCSRLVKRQLFRRLAADPTTSVPIPKVRAAEGSGTGTPNTLTVVLISTQPMTLGP